MGFRTVRQTLPAKRNAYNTLTRQNAASNLTPVLRRGKCGWFWKTSGLLGVVICSCGPVDPGEQTLARWTRSPDPVVFGTEIHPLLLDKCGNPGCHGRETTLRIHSAEPLDPGAVVNHPSELPDPLRADYYNVLAFSDLDFEEQSRILTWGSGAEPVHPGGKALSADERTALLRWLEGNP